MGKTPKNPQRSAANRTGFASSQARLLLPKTSHCIETTTQRKLNHIQGHMSYSAKYASFGNEPLRLVSLTPSTTHSLPRLVLLLSRRNSGLLLRGQIADRRSRTSGIVTLVLAPPAASSSNARNLCGMRDPLSIQDSLKKYIHPLICAKSSHGGRLH
jgi:hypothetical protein